MTLSRRDFLRALASAAAMPTIATVAACAPSDMAALASLERLLPGRVLRPGAEGYARFTSPWNLRWTGRRPIAQAVVRAGSAADVATVVRWANDTGIPIVPRSGGHSYVGYSSTTGVLIDVSSMTDVAYDAASGRARVAGGARNRNVYESLSTVSRTLTHGRCYDVGVAGLVTGGGIGFNMRRLGLTCDRLVETEMVLANGELVRANARENAELFWAVRGAGGGQFGVHTSFTFETAEAPDLFVFDITFVDGLEALLPALLEREKDAPRELGLKHTLRAKRLASGVQIELNLLGQWAGPRADLDAWLAPLRAISTPDPARDRIEPMRYWDGQAVLSDLDAPEYGYERSRYAHRAFSAAALSEVFARLRALPAATASWKGFLTGGAIADVSRTATAFVHRTDWLLTTIDLTWRAEDAPDAVLSALEWVDGFHSAMAPHTSGESYQNFIDESQTDWQTAYHGENFDRLRAVKRSVDPRDVFRFAQSVPV